MFEVIRYKSNIDQYSIIKRIDNPNIANSFAKLYSTENKNSVIAVVAAVPHNFEAAPLPDNKNLNYYLNGEIIITVPPYETRKEYRNACSTTRINAEKIYRETNYAPSSYMLTKITLNNKGDFISEFLENIDHPYLTDSVYNRLSNEVINSSDVLCVYSHGHVEKYYVYGMEVKKENISEYLRNTNSISFRGFKTKSYKTELITVISSDPELDKLRIFLQDVNKDINKIKDRNLEPSKETLLSEFLNSLEESIKRFNENFYRSSSNE